MCSPLLSVLQGARDYHWITYTWGIVYSARWVITKRYCLGGSLRCRYPCWQRLSPNLSLVTLQEYSPQPVDFRSFVVTKVIVHNQRKKKKSHPNKLRAWRWSGVKQATTKTRRTRLSLPEGRERQLLPKRENRPTLALSLLPKRQMYLSLMHAASL